MTKKPFSIFYIEANKGYFYGSNSSSLLQMDIPADVLSYFDVINKEKFYQIIQAFITANKVEPAPLLIIFAPQGTYEIDLAGKSLGNANDDVQHFLDSVPYEKVLSRTYKLQDTIKVVAVNKDVYEVIRHGFEKVHFSTVAVVALPLLQKVVPDIGTTLNLEVIANKFDAIKQYSFITLEEINNPGKPNQQHPDSNKPNPLRLYGLVGVFVVLIGVLIVMVIITMQPTPKPIIVTQPATVISTPTAIPTVRGSKEGTTSGQILSPTPRITR